MIPVGLEMELMCMIVSMWACGQVMLLVVMMSLVGCSMKRLAWQGMQYHLPRTQKCICATADVFNAFSPPEMQLVFLWNMDMAQHDLVFGATVVRVMHGKGMPHLDFGRFNM